MATLGKWSGGVIGSLVPTTSWAAPSGLFPTQDRNDGSAYSFASSTSTVTLPSSGLADGYLIVASFEFEDSSNGRHNPQGRIIQASGTGTFVGGPTGGYNRDNSEDRSYVRCWAFVDNPSASSTYQFQWRRDTDAPTGGTVRSHFEVIPFFYADIGLYSSTSTTTTGGTTPEQVTGFSGTDGTNITLSGNVVTVTGDNKRYLVLGSQYFDGLATTRTQRWHGLRIDGTKEDAAKGYSYYRNGANNQDGELFTWLIETATASVTIDQFSYRGDGVGANQGGADVAGATSSTAAGHALVVIELNDSAEVFRGTNAGQGAQSLATAGARVEVNAVGSALDFNDSASFTRVDAQGVNAEQAMDVLLGANLSGAYTSTSSARFTGYGEFTVNGAGQSETFAGNYGRGNQGTIDTYGWSANLLSALAVASGEDIGVNAGKITGGETGPVSVQPGWAGFWGVNLDTLEASGTNTNVPLDAGSYGWTGFSGNTSYYLEPSPGSYALTGQDLTVTEGSDTPVALDAGSYGLTGLSGNTSWYIPPATGSFSLTGLDATVNTAANVSVPLDAGSYALSGFAANFDFSTADGTGSFGWTGFSATVSAGSNIALDAGSFTVTGYAATVTSDDVVSLDLGAYSLTGLDASVSSGSDIALDQGSFVWTGFSGNTDWYIPPATGSYALTGNALTVSLGANELVQPVTGTFVLSGFSGNTFWYLQPATGAYSLTGYDATVTEDLGTVVGLDAGSYTLTGYAYEFTPEIVGGTGVYEWTGFEAAVTASETYSLDAGAFALTGFDAEVLRGLALGAGAYTFTGFDALAVAEQTYPLDAGSYSFDGFNAALTAEAVVSLDAGVFALSGFDATAGITGATVRPDLGAFTLLGYGVEISLTQTGVVPEDSRLFGELADNYRLSGELAQDYRLSGDLADDFRLRGGVERNRTSGKVTDG